ncbi:MAG: serine/threonine-protein kinase [Caldilineaceae bacterium]|nr:serine/threonine-protein kinase [Caldilineaceae bacterium]MCY4118635.1 serine/threonine-protein kinase [Caldilineaceae bacterium]MDE0183423.1 serine/threonine-protein kinase [Caldilineaceae bacterium]
MSYGVHAEANLLPMTSQVGRYRVLDPLGQGATAVVYLAQDMTGRRVALKVLNPMAASQPHMRLCFQLEYRTLAQLRHPGILRVHDSGEANGRLFIAMELVEGGTLEQFLQRANAIGEVAAIDIARQVAEALDYLHGTGHVHRDVKTSNVLLGPAGRAVLFDFGTVYNIHDPADNAQGIYGTPAFLAPEQIEGEEPLDGRADLYSLGIVLYLMIAGRRPFYGSREEVLEAHLKQEPPPPSEFGWVSPELEKVILKALAKPREERFESGEAFALALRGVEVETETPKPRLATRLRSWLQDTVRPE